ncbi:MAG: hypothetical protein ACJ75F_13820, partial [Flavisolibacter sp.]
FLMSCNNSSDTASTSSDNKKNSTASQWSKEDENEFLASCVDNAKARYSEDTSYSYCKCVLEKIKKDIPTADSAEIVLQDSTKIAEYTKDCH